MTATGNPVVRKILRILAISYLAYLGVVLLVVTPALNLLPSRLSEKYLGRQFHNEFSYFNPFTLNLELGRSELAETSGEPFVSLDRATINLSIDSLFSGALVFDEIGIEQLYAKVIELPGGKFNFSDLLPPDSPDTPQADTGEIPAVTIDHLSFSAHQLVYRNETRDEPYSTELNDLHFAIEGISTVRDEGERYTLQATGENGGTLHWEGEVSIPRRYSEGTLALTDLQLLPAWRFAKPWVDFELTDGTLGAQGHYRLSWGDDLEYRIDQGELRVDDLALHPKPSIDLPDTGFALGSFRLSGIALDSRTRHAAVASATVDGLDISSWLEGERVSLVDLFAVHLPEGDSAAPAGNPAADDTPAWSAELGSFRLNDGSLHWRSAFTDPEQLAVTPITLSADSIHWPLAGDSGLELSLTVNGQTSASVKGSLDLAQGNGSLSYQLDALPLAWFNPNLPAALNGRITDGLLQVSGELSLAGYSPGTIAMDGAVSGFSAKIRQAETSLTSFETVRWQKLRVDMERHRVDLARLSIDNYAGRIHINKDGSINTQKIWEEEVGEQAENVQKELAKGEPWVVHLPLVRITDSQIDFMDESLPIHFRAVIGDLNGDIRDVSSEPGAKTRVDIKGAVDGYAPVALSGTAEPLRSPPAMDLELTFEGVDMALLSPYSGTYAGYAIERGTLNLDLKYAMQDDRLKGNNKILISQMKLGEKVKSDKAVDLPLELALALLTDSKGVIDMEVPVSGNVNNPDFSIGSVVLGAVGNLITKAVTSPFTLLAGLADSKEDLQRLSFATGSAQIREATRGKLEDLGKALGERPELKLVIAGRLQLKADREALQKHKLHAELLAAGLSESELAGKGPDWEAAIEERYQAMTPGDTELTVREQYLQLARSMPLADSELLDLASARAVAVKTYLVNEAGLAPDRAVISKSNLDTKANLYSGAELEVEI